MSEIDPWALPQSGPVDTAGIPRRQTAYGYPATGPVKPLSPIPAIIVMTFGALYIIATVTEIFIINGQISLINTLNGDAANGTLPSDAASQVQAYDSRVNAGSWTATTVYFITMLAIILWERQLKNHLGSVGARRAVFAKAGYTYFRATWVISFALGLFLTSQATNNNLTTIQDVTTHDHELMLYFALRAVLGGLLIFFAYRLMKMSQEGIHRLLAVAQR